MVGVRLSSGVGDKVGDGCAVAVLLGIELGLGVRVAVGLVILVAVGLSVGDLAEVDVYSGTLCSGATDGGI